MIGLNSVLRYYFICSGTKNSHSKWLKSFLCWFSLTSFRIWFWKLCECFTWKKEVVFIFLHEFKLGHNFVLWQCSARCYQNYIAEAHKLRIWAFATSNIFFCPLINRPYLFLKASSSFFKDKKHSILKEK